MIFIGVNGHFVSQHIKQCLIDFFVKKDNYNDQNLDDIHWIYNKLIENKHDLLKKAYLKSECSLFTQKYECGFSGCTAVTTIMIGNKILCANAGDSRAIIVEFNEDWKVKELSRDHKPELPDELERIQANNGRVERYTSSYTQHFL